MSAQCSLCSRQKLRGRLGTTFTAHVESWGDKTDAQEIINYCT